MAKPRALQLSHCGVGALPFEESGERVSSRSPRRNTACTSSRSRTGTVRCARPWEHCASHHGLAVAEAGGASTDQAANTLMSKDFRKAELTSVPITLVLLIAVFGALIAAGIPVLLAGSAVIVAVSLLAVPSRWLPIGSSTSEVVLIIGMAVGVDYSLFYLRREREERAQGASFPAALATAAATSGRAIVVSGLTVMISLAGLLLTGIDLFTGIAVGTITVVGVAVVGSLTFLDRKSTR